MLNAISKKVKTLALRISYAVIGLVVMFAGLIVLAPATVSAAQITARKVTLSTSSPAAAAATTTYTFNFTVPTTGTIVKSFAADACTTASGTCTTPTGFSVSSATISQPTNLGDASGWTVNTSTAGSLRLTKTTDATTPTSTQTVVFNNVQNPTTTNTTFFLRLTTYSDAAWTTAIDTGTVATSTATQINVTASVDETLVFCTGTSGITNSSCAGATGSTVALGTLSSSSTNSGLSQMGAGTNASSGYSITVNGTTLTCSTCSGSPTIAALASQTASSTGTAQFGLNLRANTTPSVGADPDGSGSATYTANYGTANQYRFVSGDSVASYNGPDLFKRFQVSYIANITTATVAGPYSTTLTYICTATF